MGAYFIKLLEAVLDEKGNNIVSKVVINPWTGLMGLLETANFICGVGILPSVSHLSGLRCPEIHSPRTGYGRVSVAC